MEGFFFKLNGDTFQTGNEYKLHIAKDWFAVGWDAAYYVTTGNAFWCVKAIAPDGEVEWALPYRFDHLEIRPPKWIRELDD